MPAVLVVEIPGIVLVGLPGWRWSARPGRRRPSALNLLAHLRKSLIINGAGEWNRTLVTGLFSIEARGGLKPSPN